MIHADLRDNVPAADRCTTRYLVQPVPPEHQDFLAWVVLQQGHLNGVSKRTRLRPVEVVRHEGKLTRLVRLNLVDYGLSTAVWERLGTVDPYFHDVQEVHEYREYPQGYQWQGKTYAPGRYWTGKTTVQRAITFWTTSPTAQRQLADVCAWTQSDAFCLDGAWFFNQTATADGRTVSYYDLLGIKKLQDFERVVRFDAKLADGLEHLRNLNFSGISLGPRRLARESAFWITFDNRHDGRQRDEDDPTVTLDRKRFKFVAQRAFAPLPNGLPAWWLGNAAGELQVKAPDDVIGCAPGATGNDGRLHINVRCWECHTRSKTEDCIKGFKALRPNKLRDYDPEALRILEDQYLREKRLNTEMAIDRLLYREAVAEITGGWTTQQYGQAYASAWEYYENARVDLTWAADRLFADPQDVRRAFNAAERAEYLHPLLSTLLRPEGDDNQITIRQWERVYPEAQRTLIGYVAGREKAKEKK